jgi:hypothetical protein
MRAAQRSFREYRWHWSGQGYRILDTKPGTFE